MKSHIVGFIGLVMFFSGPHQHLTNAQFPTLTLMGASSTKEFYITDNRTDDFARSLRFICPDLFGLQLASLENDEEYQVVDDWFGRTYGNSSWPVKAWTSAFRMGAIPFTWATTGNAVSTANRTLDYPWPAGGWNGASYSWNTCLSVYRKCSRPPGAPAGCFPAATVYYYSDCRELNRIICQKSI